MPKFEYDKIRLPSSDNIRILSLAASKTFSDPIYVNLSVADLASPPIYEALSYCWGDASDGRFMFCDGMPCPVTQNLESALRHLRQSEGNRTLWIDAICINQNDLAERASQVNLMRHIFRNARRVVVWLGPSKIDNMVAFRFCERMMKGYGGCFDSNSSPLDSVEVSRLRSPPSSRAGTQQSIKHILKETKRHEAITRSRTYLLGVMAAYHDNEIRNTTDRLEKTEREAETGGVATEETINLAQKIFRTKVISARTGEEITDPTGAEVVAINMLLGRPLTHRWIHQEETPDPTDAEVMAINILFRRPWFSRCWVFQEAALGREVLMLCGTRHIKWEALYLGMFRVLLGRNLHWAPDKRFITGHRLLMNNLRLELHDRVQEEPFDLLQLLWDTRSLHATDPRDKVYSLLGLINQKEAGVGGLTPDYSVSVEECYKRTTLAIMSYTRNLDVLITEQNSESTLNLPSWVPDWDYLEKPAPLQIMGYRGWAGSKEVTNNPIYRRFRASGSDQYYTATTVNGDALKLLGYVFDTIIALERVMEPSKPRRLGFSRNSWKSDCVSLIGFIDSVGTYFDVLARWEKPAFSRKESEYPTGEDPGTVFTMTMTTGIMDGPKTVSTILKEWRWCLRWYNAISILRPFIISTWIYNFLMCLIVSIFCLYTGPRGRIAPNCFMEGSRRLARTKKGYLALVPRHSIVGDEILLLRGGSVPFVVRATPHENGYNLIGPSYVRGIMNGEAWDSSLTGDITIF